MEDNMVFAPAEGCSQDQQYTGRHLTIWSSWDRDRNVFESMDFSRLRSLTVFGEWRSFFMSKKMQLLRVLDLEDTTSNISDDNLEQIAKLMSRLKFLSLRGRTSVSRLPTSLGNLKQLETLDVRYTFIPMLPSTITNLEKLQYICAGSTVSKKESQSIQPRSCSIPMFCRRQFIIAHLGVKVPRGIGKLTALGTLGVVNVGAFGGKAFLKELKNFTQVRKLGVSGINIVGNFRDFYSAISAHNHLMSSVGIDKDEQSASCCVNDISERLKSTLKSLKLYGFGDKFPAWIQQLRCINKLDLEMTVFMQEMIDSLAAASLLLCLRLCVKPIQEGEHNLVFRRQGNCQDFFPIRILEIDYSSRLLLTFRESVLKSLEVLKVHCSSGLQISGLAHLEKLKQVWLIGSCDEALKQDVDRQLAEHPNEFRPVLKLEGVSSGRCLSIDSLSFSSTEC